jgi:hypothetical protein
MGDGRASGDYRGRGPRGHQFEDAGEDDCSLAHDIKPAAQIVRDLVREAETIMACLQSG